eukprot:Gregarina_sp_Poly_1__5232@NODE_2773_length_1736_cov_6_934092_g1751_i0_p1_GENE_NODE_2773_length_1736_cov_6_934092_g1751_i0NODE_2773_length_1736_cov_6_934092_g1751_i0_p1_ORF_typecomplete_len126_score11_72rve/PF00665_26/7_2e12Ferrochelatase/PF00762_19/0_17_NODE_2773_length_1736_cov_6_934092_g1751_i0476853
MVADIMEECQRCAVCCAAKAPNSKPYGLLNPVKAPREPWEEIQIDYVKLPPEPTKGLDCILTVVDRFSRRLRLIPCMANISAEESAALLVNGIFTIHGIPKVIASDRDSRFTSELWARLGLKRTG